ncbi:MAG: LysM peptidoglycan-binding domain-containing protein [Candidatus Aenigmarchaeota archaeon]|nr:LysM peptidoglycan-binding domain-containing protein [Candidatus Aenigmarchaeota archaeon]
MEELGYRDNRADRGVFSSAAEWGMGIYRNWFPRKGKYANFSDAPRDEIQRIMDGLDYDIQKMTDRTKGCLVKKTEIPIPSNGKTFYNSAIANYLFGNNGKKMEKPLVVTDYSLSKPLLLEHKGSAKEKILDFPFEDRVPFEEELLELAPEYAFEDKVPFEEELLELAPEKLDEEILELVPEKTRRKHHTDKYILSEDMKNSLKGEDTETAAKYFMNIKGVGYKTAAKLLGEVGKHVDEKQLRKWYKAVKNKEYETVEEFSYKYSLMLDELYESEMEGCGGAAYPSGTMNTEGNEIALQDEALMFENGGDDRYNPTEILAKSIMSVKGIKPKKAGRLLTKYYEKIETKVDFDESQLKTWYEEVMKENGSHHQFKNLDDWAGYAVNLHGTAGIVTERKGYWVRKRKSKWQYYKQLAPLLIPAALMIVAADTYLNHKLSDKAMKIVGLKKPAYTAVYSPQNPFDALNLPANKEMQLEAKNESLPNIVAEIRPAANKENIYNVNKGDCLWNIAKNLKLDTNIGNAVKKIVEENKGKYPTLENNPDHIEAGWMLKIPKF